MGLGKFIERMRDARASKTASDAEKYAQLIRRGAVHDLTPAQSKHLEALAETLGKTPEDIASDERIIVEFNDAKELGKSADAKRAASKTAGIDRDKHAEDVSRIRIEQDRRQQELVDEVGRAQQAASEASRARERAAAIASKHHDLLGIPKPAAVAPAVNALKAPSPSGNNLGDLAATRRVLSPEEIQATAKRTEARQRAALAPSGASIAQLENNIRAHDATLAAAAPPKTPGALDEKNDSHALAAGRAAAGRG